MQYKVRTNVGCVTGTKKPISIFRLSDFKQLSLAHCQWNLDFKSCVFFFLYTYIIFRMIVRSQCARTHVWSKSVVFDQGFCIHVKSCLSPKGRYRQTYELVVGLFYVVSSSGTKLKITKQWQKSSGGSRYVPPSPPIAWLLTWNFLCFGSFLPGKKSSASDFSSPFLSSFFQFSESEFLFTFGLVGWMWN